MSLPVYQHLSLKTASMEEISSLLTPDLNLKHPVAFNLLELSKDEQRELAGLIENYFVSHNISFKFPYPVYLVTENEAAITKIPSVKDPLELPRFFSQKDSKMNVKESHLAGKNKLLQQSVKNNDSSATMAFAETYGDSHRMIYELEKERNFYRGILTQLIEAKEDE